MPVKGNRLTSLDGVPLRLGQPVLTVANKETDTLLGVPMQETKPLVPAALVPVAAVLAAVLGFLGTLSIIPQPFGALAAILGFVAAGLAGVAGKAPGFSESKPLVPLALVPLFATAGPVLVSVADEMQPGLVKTGLTAGAMLLFWLAGKAMPAPQVKA